MKRGVHEVEILPVAHGHAPFLGILFVNRCLGKRGKHSGLQGKGVDVAAELDGLANVFDAVGVEPEHQACQQFDLVLAEIGYAAQEGFELYLLANVLQSGRVEALDADQHAPQMGPGKQRQKLLVEHHVGPAEEEHVAKHQAFLDHGRKQVLGSLSVARKIVVLEIDILETMFLVVLELRDNAVHAPFAVWRKHARGGTIIATVVAAARGHDVGLAARCFEQRIVGKGYCVKVGGVAGVYHPASRPALHNVGDDAFGLTRHHGIAMRKRFLRRNGGMHAADHHSFAAAAKKVGQFKSPGRGGGHGGNADHIGRAELLGIDPGIQFFVYRYLMAAIAQHGGQDKRPRDRVGPCVNVVADPHGKGFPHVGGGRNECYFHFDKSFTFR